MCWSKNPRLVAIALFVLTLFQPIPGGLTKAVAAEAPKANEGLPPLPIENHHRGSRVHVSLAGDTPFDVYAITSRRVVVDLPSLNFRVPELTQTVRQHSAAKALVEKIQILPRKDGARIQFDLSEPIRSTQGHIWSTDGVRFYLAIDFFAPDPEAQREDGEDRWTYLDGAFVQPSQLAASIDLPGRIDVRGLRLVAGGAADVGAVLVTYRPDTTFLDDSPMHLGKGERTKPIDETTVFREVTRVDLFFSRENAAKKPVWIEVWGLQRPPRQSGGVADGFARAQRRGGPPSLQQTPKKVETTADTIRRAQGVAAAGVNPANVTVNSKELSTQSLECVKSQDCAAIPVYFGTDRNQVDRAKRIGFGAERADRLLLGEALVTVPRHGRASGAIPLPGYADKYLWSTPAGGDPKHHFTIPDGGVQVFDNEDTFLLATRRTLAESVRNGADGRPERHAFVFVHGYSVSFDDAAYRTAQIAYDLAPDGALFAVPFVYSWPSGGSAADYQYDQESARLAVPHLVKFLRLIVDKIDATHVHLIAHSMGNYPLILALDEVRRSASRPKVNQIILAAPDIDKKEFEKLATRVTSFASGVTLYASSTDRALLLSRLGRRNAPRAGDVFAPPGPAVVEGVDTIDISALSSGIFSWFGWNHSTYADARELINDMAAQFRYGPNRPDSRNVNFEPVGTAEHRYWRYRN
ncbi:MAG: alpha/beta hydrolase [Hyphomicrobiaceae bacterium]|nr:alpha/beta hydrolase [Hyphomicrobiaceae bacterium]